MSKLKKSQLLGFCLCLVLLFATQSCSFVNKMVRSQGGRALVCGGGGAVTGAIVYYGCDALTGERAACIAGASASALADGINCWWQLSQKIVDDYESTRKTLNYDDNQGTIVKILAFDADKTVVHPGEEIKLHMSYALMSPYATQEIKLEQKLKRPGDSKPIIEIITRQPGTWGTDQDYSVKIDPSTPEGKTEIMLELKLVDQQSKQDHDKRIFCFTVTRSNTPPPNQLCSSANGGSSALGTYQVNQNTNIRNKPSAKANILARVLSGQSFPVMQMKKQGSSLWYKIKLEDGREGWLPSNMGTMKKN